MLARFILRKTLLSISFLMIYSLAMFKPLLPYLVFYTQKVTCKAEISFDIEKEAEERIGAYVGVNGRNYLNGLKKRINIETKGEHKPLIPSNSNDVPSYTYDTFYYRTKEILVKTRITSPHFSKHFVISEYSTSIFRPPECISS